ncbi:MAG: alkaline phosphatase family protein [Oscillospiraceae bacterium]|nr:alkaline phosphatase family protein [Oscillospiraceae bacterium]
MDFADYFGHGTRFPDYAGGTLAIPNSLLAHYGATPHHATLPILDNALRAGYRNVVQIVLDGMGSALLTTHSPSGFFARHNAADVSAVLPSTTVAALTSFESGLSPIEHGWLGWACYFKEMEKVVDMFSGNESGTQTRVADVRRLIPYDRIFERIRVASPDVTVSIASPFSAPAANTVTDICARVTELCAESGRHFIYAYNPQPDTVTHDNGCKHELVGSTIREYERQIERLCAELRGTLVIVTADHGLTDVRTEYLQDYPEVSECLAAPMSVEQRCVSLFVKNEYLTTFALRWNARFGDSFKLLSRREALELELFGAGVPHPRALEFIGDYIAVATGNVLVKHRRRSDGREFAASHAGARTEEMTVPVILVG